MNTASAVHVRPVSPADAADWERLRGALWPAEPGEHAAEIAAFLAGARLDPTAAFLALDAAGQALGLAEASIRSHAEGCRPGRVAYLEGWYVVPEARRRGLGAALVAAVADWGRAQGCTELASDTEIENTISLAAHRALGFDEVERIICFRLGL